MLPLFSGTKQTFSGEGAGADSFPSPQHPAPLQVQNARSRAPGVGWGPSLPRLGFKGLAPRAAPPHPPQPLPGAGEKATGCLGEVPSPGGEGAHAAVYSVPVLLEAQPLPPDSVGHPRAASSEEARSREPSGTRPEASAAPGPGRAGKLEVSDRSLLFLAHRPSPPPLQQWSESRGVSKDPGRGGGRGGVKSSLGALRAGFAPGFWAALSPARGKFSRRSEHSTPLLQLGDASPSGTAAPAHPARWASPQPHPRGDHCTSCAHAR